MTARDLANLIAVREMLKSGRASGALETLEVVLRENSAMPTPPRRGRGDDTGTAGGDSCANCAGISSLGTAIRSLAKLTRRTKGACDRNDCQV